MGSEGDVTDVEQMTPSAAVQAGVTIRAMELTDIPALAGLMRRHDGWIGAYKNPPPDTAAGAVQLLTRQLARHLRGVGWYGVIVEAGELRGQVALVPMPGREAGGPGEDGRLEVLVWVEPDAAGRGLGRRAVQALCEVGFEDLGLPTIYARVRPGNAPSLAIFRGFGFREVSVDRRWVVLRLSN